MISQDGQWKRGYGEIANGVLQHDTEGMKHWCISSDIIGWLLLLHIYQG